MELDADNESCLFYRGLALAKLGRKDEADDNSLKLLGLDADDASNHVSRGWVLVETDKGEEAVQHFSEALRIDSSSEDAKAGLIHAVILTRPILGRPMKLIQKLDSLPFWLPLLGFLVLGRFKNYLEKGAGLPFLGDLMDSLVWALIFILLSAQLLFEWSLRSNSLTKHVLPERHLRGIKWALPCLIVAIPSYVLWVVGGTKSIPVVTLLMLSIACLIREIFESDNAWVRVRMRVLTGGAGLIVIGILYSLFFVIFPMAQGVIAALEEAARDQANPDVDLVSQVRPQVEEMLSLRRWTVMYPTLVIVVLAALRDNVTEWLQTKAPDEGWE